MQDMIIDCVSIAVVSYAISVSVAKAFAKKNNYKVDANQVSVNVPLLVRPKFIVNLKNWKIVMYTFST